MVNVSTPEPSLKTADGYDAFVANHPGQDLALASGVRYHYLDEGEGEPVVMLHGNPSWSYYYRNLVNELVPNGYRCVVPDHVGCGRSEKPGDDRYTYTLESRVNDLESLLDHLNLREDLTLVMHDWGGGVGSAFAARHPERVARLVVLNTAGFLLPASKSFPWALWFCRNTPLSAWFVRGLNGFCKGTARIGCKRRTMPPQVVDAYLRPYDSWANRVAIHRFVQDIPLRPTDRAYGLMSHTQDQLGTFAGLPVFIGWGLRDFVFDRHFLAEWQRRFPNAEVHAIPDAGHYTLEDAGDVLIPRIRDFLGRHPVSRPLD